MLTPRLLRTYWEGIRASYGSWRLSAPRGLYARPAHLAFVQGANTSASVPSTPTVRADSYRDGKTAAPPPRRGLGNVVKGSPPDSVLGDFRRYARRD